MSASIYLNLYMFVLYALSAMTTSSSVVLKLIHPHLVHKLYNNSNTALLSRTEESYIERHKYLTSRITSRNESIYTKISPNIYANSFHVNFSIGKPPVWQIVAMDSGSYLLWIPCHPCPNCNFKSDPIYDPFKSSTYESISCDSDICGDLGDCRKSRNCTYFLKYGDYSTTSGEIGLEKLNFWSTLDNDTSSLSNIVFGCAHNNKGPGTETGILGLGAHRVSLVSQLGSRFSYCLGDINNIDYEHNRLAIGEYASMEGTPTPLETDSDGLYYLKLKGVSVGDKRLDIDPNLFKRKASQGGVIIDSGTTLTLLARSAYDIITEEMQKELDGVAQRVFFLHQPKGLCYNGSLLEQRHGFPDVTYHFAGTDEDDGEDADFAVESEGMFRQYGEEFFCLAVEAVEDDEISVIGLYAQQYYNIGFDLKSMTLYFENVGDCEGLE